MMTYLFKLFCLFMPSAGILKSVLSAYGCLLLASVQFASLLDKVDDLSIGLEILASLLSPIQLIL